jgi:hypothetical protein
LADILPTQLDINDHGANYMLRQDNQQVIQDIPGHVLDEDEEEDETMTIIEEEQHLTTTYTNLY